MPTHRPITSSHVTLTFGSEIHSELISTSLLFPLHPRSKDTLNVEPQHRSSTLNLDPKMYHALANKVQGWCGGYRIQGYRRMGSNGLCVWYVSLSEADSSSADVLLLQCVVICLKVSPIPGDYCCLQQVHSRLVPFFFGAVLGFKCHSNRSR